ncbi:MAG: XshC-Cox1-family protein [Betaproteobacteria bacterium]|jgi:xanthine dehydrogenase accessory factor|nr:XshC-Cox1-family protein [Betaproteobacteria bacterium]NBY17104.1 XshC-Cox1-family protein [Betaproteobacteria bacterium]
MNARQVLEAAHRLQQNDQAFALVSVLRVEAPASARPGDKAVVTADGIIHGWIGGGCAQPAVLRTVREALADGRSRVIRIAPADAETPGPSTTAVNSERRLEDILEFGMTCHSGGILELFIDPIVAQTQLTIIGDTPLAAALCELAPRVGLTVTVIAHQADPGRFPAADRVLTNDEDAPGIARQHASLNGCFIVVATQGRRDLQGLRLALSLPGRQTFFVASARKAQVLKAALKESGEAVDHVDAIVAPAGQLLGAQTPEEIALSVLAAVVAARRERITPPAQSLLPPRSPETPVAPQVPPQVPPQVEPSVEQLVGQPVSIVPALVGGSCCGS